MSFLIAALFQVDPSTMDVTTAAKTLMDAITSKNWWLVAGLVVWLLVRLARTYGTKIPFVGKFLALGWSGPFLAALFSATGAMITALVAGEGMSVKLLFAILGAAASAVFTQETMQKAGEAAAGGLKTAEDADKFFKGK